MNTNETAVTQTAAVAETPEQGTRKATKKASKKQAKPAARKEPKPASKKESKAVGKKTAKKDAKPSVPREFSKKAAVIDLMRRKEGATLADIAKTTGWANHSIRGFVSGQLTKKMGLTVESTKNDAGERVYRIASK